MLGVGLSIPEVALRPTASASGVALLFANGEQGAFYDIGHTSSLYQDAAKTMRVSADGDPVLTVEDKSGNGNDAAAPDDSSRPLYRTDGSDSWLRTDFVDDAIVASLPAGKYDLAYATRYGVCVSPGQDVGPGYRLPLADPTAIILMDSAAGHSEAELVAALQYRSNGNGRKSFIGTSNDLTQYHRIVSPNNPYTITYIGANGVEYTVQSDGSSQTVDLAAQGLTAPITAVFPDGILGDTNLSQFHRGGNSLTGSVTDLSGNTSLTASYCYGNSLTGSLPDLSANTSLLAFYCYYNNLTGWAGGSIAAVAFRAQSNALPQPAVDGILQALDANGKSNGTCVLSGGTNAAPSTTGEVAIDSLRGKGWTVTVTGGY